MEVRHDGSFTAWHLVSVEATNAALQWPLDALFAFAASIGMTPHWPSPRLAALAASGLSNRKVNQS